MDFYKKQGVGRLSIEEQSLIDYIKMVVEEKGIRPEAIPECNTIDDLIFVKQFVDELDDHPIRHERVIEEMYNELDESQDTQAIESTSNQEESNDLYEDVEEVQTTEDFSVLNQPAEEPILNFEDRPNQFVADNYSPFADPIIERSYNQAESARPVPGNDDEESLELEESQGNPLSDLPPHTKRRTAEQTADTILKGYAQFAPIPFKWMSKFPESKIEKMAFNGEIDLSIEVSEGVAFDDYMKQTNAQLDEIFEVDTDTLSDIREPLIEVLMEQNMELTPTQRLVAAVISHLVQMFTVALKLRQQNNRILSYQKHLTYLMQGSKIA